MKLRTLVSTAMAGLLAVGLSVTAAGPAHAAPSIVPSEVAGSYQTVPPQRVLDTRIGIGAPKASIGPLSTVTFDIPDSISPSIGAVLLEVTVVNPTAPGYATVFSSNSARPVVSNINFQAGQNVPNTVIVRTAGGYSVSIFNGSKGTVDLLADVQGYFQSGENRGEPGTLVPVTPIRYLDTRAGLGAPKGKVAPHSVTTLQIGNVGGAVPVNASAVALNLTAVGSGGSGFLTAYAGGARPEVSTVNFQPGENRANLTLTALDANGRVTIYNGSQYSVDLLADVTGYFTSFPVDPVPLADGAYLAAPGLRVLDTRQPGAASGTVPSLATLKVQVFQPGSLAAVATKAVAVNVTAVQPQAAGFFTTWDGTTAVPAVSNVNFQAKRTAAGSVVVPLNPDGSIYVYNGSFGNVDILVDLDGIFTKTALLPDAARSAVTSAVDPTRKAAVLRHH